MKIWFKNPTLEALKVLCKDTMVEYLGMELTEVGEDFLKGRMPVDHRTKQPLGLLHGGGSVALAETLASLAGNMVLDENDFYAVGMEINANHIRAIKDGWVEGVSRPIHIGKTTQVWETKIHNEKKQLICVSRMTLAVLPKR